MFMVHYVQKLRTVHLYQQFIAISHHLYLGADDRRTV